MKKIIFALALLIAPVMYAHATPFETSIATFTGDFSEGGDFESSERLLGNSSSTGYGFGILQQNRVRIYVASGTRNGGYSLVDSTPSTAGYVGIWTDGVSQIPQYTLDVWGNFRSTGSAYLATSTGNVGIGLTTPTVKLDVNGDIRANNFIGSIVQTASAYSSYSLTLDGGDLAVAVSTTGFDPLALRFVTGISTLNLTAVRFYTLSPSTVGATNFRIAYTTTTNVTPSTWSYITQQVAVTTSTVFSDWISLVGNTVNSGQKISVHITAVPASGTPASKYGVIILYWRKQE